ncbi:MAG: NUDIX domain-containing protein [Pirellulaceae bacterium]|jgi:mutator protein MutT|nr:NUDIX domain-containing protein [Pirellulaceae bacterium]MDP7017241.1 NUDIX domain-containing protein [Pirellulaceae bacterium]
MSASPTRIAIAVVEWEGAFLVGRRSDNQKLAGLHEFPGGKIEDGETPAEAAARECREESGLQVDVVRELLTETHTYDHDVVELHFLSCEPIAPGQQPSGPFQWVPRSQLATCNFPSGNRRLLALLSE